MELVDLKVKYGQRYRVRTEDGSACNSDPWLAQIECRNGHIYPYGGEFLGAATNYPGRVANQLRNLACAKVVQDGSDGVNVKFHVDDFEIITKIMKPRSIRRLLPAHKQKLLAANRYTRFGCGSKDCGRDRRGPSARQGDSKVELTLSALKNTVGTSRSGVANG